MGFFSATIRNFKILHCRMVVTRENNADLNAALCVLVAITLGVNVVDKKNLQIQRIFDIKIWREIEKLGNVHRPYFLRNTF